MTSAGSRDKPDDKPVARNDDAPASPPTLGELFTKANAGRTSLVEWVYMEARFRGRLVVAEKRLARLEGMDSAVQYRTACLETDAAMQLALQHRVAPHAMAEAEEDVRDAAEAFAFCSRMIEIVKLHPIAKGTTPNGTPQNRTGNSSQPAPRAPAAAPRPHDNRQVQGGQSGGQHPGAVRPQHSTGDHRNGPGGGNGSPG